jgi:hypothetical protein
MVGRNFVVTWLLALGGSDTRRTNYPRENFLTKILQSQILGTWQTMAFSISTAT